jgi:quercetin dioxygenase-like cupin family protein
MRMPIADEPAVPPPTGGRPFRRRTVRIAPGEARPYRPADWHDCLVVVESGEVLLELDSGARHTCRTGDILWLAGLPVRRLVNPGSVPVVIRTVRRR